MFHIKLLSSKLQSLQRDVRPTVLSVFAILAPIHINNVRLKGRHMNKTGLLLMALCIGLSGCVSGLNGQVRSQGTIIAVNASEQTIQIKTDQGESLVMSVAASTDLRDGEGPFRWKKKTTLDQIKAGNFLIVQHSKSPEGKLIAVQVYVFSKRPENLRGAPQQF